MDYFLKFDSEEQANAILYTTTPATQDEDGNVLTEAVVKQNYANIDVLGIIYEPQEPSELTDEPVEPVALPGWHVNVRVVSGEDGAALEPYRVAPKNPRRVWA